jgi:hypothetical protein
MRETKKNSTCDIFEKVEKSTLRDREGKCANSEKVEK